MNFMKTSYIRSTSPLNFKPDKTSEYLPTEDVYLGMAAHKSLQTLQSDLSTKADECEVKVIFECTHKLYVDAVKQIKQQFLFADKLLTLCEILGPTKSLDIGALGLLQKILLRYSAPL